MLFEWLQTTHLQNFTIKAMCSQTEMGHVHSFSNMDLTFSAFRQFSHHYLSYFFCLL